MNAGFAIDLGEKLGFWSPSLLGFRLLSRQIGEPPKDDRSERVPYSSVTHHFEDSAPSYGERTLSYKFDLVNRDNRNVQFLLSELRRYLTWDDVRDLHDSSFPDYHFEARAPDVKVDEGQLTVRLITITFQANPAMLPNQIPPLTESEIRYPDLNGDGHVTAADAALILNAVDSIAAGASSGLTPSQELLADADLDGAITEKDSLLVLQYASAVFAGKFEDTAENWQKYLRRHLAMKGALY